MTVPNLGINTLDRWIILTVLVFVFVSGYLYEVWPYEGDYGFPYNDKIRINQRWYIFILMKDLRDVALVWLVWRYAIPRSAIVLKGLTMVVCMLLTLIPINFMLFYFPPFKPVSFIVKLMTTVLITLIYYKHGNIDYNRHRSNN
jgi:magnesium-transporting ATPase (P-type)